jgi:hypothetical protein
MPTQNFRLTPVAYVRGGRPHAIDDNWDRETDQQSLIAWLTDRDCPCPLCQYNLRGLTTPRCPECGQSLQLSVSLAEPYLKAWIATLVGLLLPAGIGVLLICGLTYALMTEGARALQGMRYTTFGEAYLMLHATLCVPVSVVTLCIRRRFQAWGRPAQITCAISAWLAVLISAMILLSEIR